MRRQEPIDRVGPATNYPARSGGWAPRSTDPLVGLVLDYGLHTWLAATAAAHGDEATATAENQEALLTIGRIMAARRETPP